MGKKQSPEVVLKRMQSRFLSQGTLVPSINSRKNSTWKAGWRDIGDKRIYARSAWEANYGRYLEFLKKNGAIKDWEHEPETFWFSGVKRGCVSYLPDFRLLNNDESFEYHEVKGWMDSRSKNKNKKNG